MKRLKGPELKLSELRAPSFVTDVFYDLRDRRLLPLVALVLVAIAAVPFLLGGGEEAVPPPALVETIEAGEGAADGMRLAVVEATPGLRDYRKRLSRRQPTDPFQQRHAGPVVGGAKLNPEGSGGGTETTTVTVGGGGGPGTTTTTTTSDPVAGGRAGERPRRYYRLVFDVQISRTEPTADGGRVMGEPKLRKRVKALTQLPGEKAPVVTTMGVDAGKETVLLMVSHDVTAVEGDAECVAGDADRCQLLEVAAGFPLILTYGPNDVRYVFKVIRLDVEWLTPAEAKDAARERRVAWQAP